MASPGVATEINAGKPFEELVRYRFKTGSTATVDDHVIFRALQPSWQVDR
jgi:hypothetical protein